MKERRRDEGIKDQQIKVTAVKLYFSGAFCNVGRKQIVQLSVHVFGFELGGLVRRREETMTVRKIP